jgi:hypothetical protein
MIKVCRLGGEKTNEVHRSGGGMMLSRKIYVEFMRYKTNFLVNFPTLV